MALGQDFFDYARLSKTMQLRLKHKGPYAITEQVGQYGEPGYVASDLTVGLIDPVISYPDDRQDLDVAGRSNGPALSFDNSLSYPGSQNDISAPMAITVVAPNHAHTVATETVVSFSGLRNSLRGETATVTAKLNVPREPVSLLENLSNIVPANATFKYHNGTSFVAVDGVRIWDGDSTITFDVTLPSAVSGTIRIESTFANTAGLGTYAWTVSAESGGTVLFADQTDEFDVVE